MFNYKRLSFLFFFLTIFLLATDTQTERQVRRSLLSLFNIVVEESGQVSDTAPTTFFQTLENIRVGTYNFLATSSNDLNRKSQSSKGILSILLNLATYIVLFLKFIAGFVITFYPFVIFLLYSFLTSRVFKRDDFGYDNF